MLAIERKNEILTKLRLEQRVLVSELAAHYGVTEETIRRDLDKLEKDGYATKTYGGAIWGNSTKTDLSYTIRNKTNVEAKHAIAELVDTLIVDGDHIMLDESSTALYIAKQIKEKKDLTVITNSVEIIVELSDVGGWNIMSTGGQLKQESLELVGTQCHQMIRNYHVDKVIFSCKGIDPNAGVTDSSEYHSSTKQEMMRSARQSILALDYSKFDKVSFVRIADLGDLQTIVTNREPSRQWLQLFERLNIRCLYPAVNVE
jgi:DeoR/GlpR family transcriptional regulator of sugar metabolism